jgi:hypothetical protein
MTVIALPPGMAIQSAPGLDTLNAAVMAAAMAGMLAGRKSFIGARDDNGDFAEPKRRLCGRDAITAHFSFLTVAASFAGRMSEIGSYEVVEKRRRAPPSKTLPRIMKAASEIPRGLGVRRSAPLSKAIQLCNVGALWTFYLQA